MSEQVNTPTVNLLKMEMDKLGKNLADVECIKMNALTYLDLLKECKSSYSTHWALETYKELGKIVLCNTMNRNTFILE